MTVTEQAAEHFQEAFNPGRMIADGIPYPDYAAALEQAQDVDSWFRFWSARGDAYEGLADEALADRRRVSAGEWLFHAALSYHYAQFMAFEEPAKREAGQRKKVELYNRAAALFAPPAERVEVAFEGATLPGFLRLPPGEGPWPCAVLIGGLESTKEEYYLFENICLRRGLATFAFDGPGQGEAFFDVKLRPDFERYTSAVVDYLEGRPELDPKRLGVVGRSLGGYYAARSAAAETRFRAGISWGVFYDMSEFDDMPPLTQVGFAYVTGADSFEEGREICRRSFDLGDVAAGLQIPYYILQGRHDPIFSERQTRSALKALGHAELEAAVEEGGDHCCHNMAHIVRPRMVDWLANQLGAMERSA